MEKIQLYFMHMEVLILACYLILKQRDLFGLKITEYLPWQIYVEEASMEKTGIKQGWD